MTREEFEKLSLTDSYVWENAIGCSITSSDNPFRIMVALAKEIADLRMRLDLLRKSSHDYD
jgi:hypothetical protein